MPDTWQTRVWREYRVRNLTRAARDVLLALAGYPAPQWPAHATLAERARCCVRTVQRALDHARALGLLTWTERRVRRGWRWLRTSNVYRLAVPDTAVTRNFRATRTTGQPARRLEKTGKSAALNALMAEAARAPDLLAARREAMARLFATANRASVRPT